MTKRLDPCAFGTILALVVLGLVALACFAYPLSAPVAASVSSPVGWRVRPFPAGGDTEGLHRGVDYSCPVGTTVLAAGSGVVVATWPVPGTQIPGRPRGMIYRGWGDLGAAVLLDHGNGLWSIYGHLSRIDVRRGQYVVCGTQLGLSGNSGRSTGPHLHFELVVSPLLFFDSPLGPALRDPRELLR